ncbi:MAG TPA: class I SAM-dependent RNA methyltransferase [Planctomycetaceae bacterium]|nr:class I SAM-dependent RNA methyltransferase [Planctomycetaceae bacterium]
MSRLNLIATAAFGLEAVVSRELTDLGYGTQQVEDGRVRFVGDELAVCRTNLWLRSADRVLIEVGSFPARSFGQLFDQTTELPWEQWVPADGKFPVEGKSIRSGLHHVPTIQSVVKKAIVERLKKSYQRHWFQETGVEYPIEVGLLRDQVTLTIDTSGAGLHKRGYRRVAGIAPLRETTAAALVLLSYWNAQRPFLDPFCGAGTIAIEAALIGRNRAPGINRNFLAETWGQIQRETWKQAREEARDAIKGKFASQLVASDIDPQAIKLAETAAADAGVMGDIQFRTMDVLELKTQREYGVVICNPPYGERMGDEDHAAAIYDDMADAFDPLTTWSIYVLTGHPGFERHFRRRADRRRKLYNGRIECTYYQYFGPRPPGDAFHPTEDQPDPSA